MKPASRAPRSRAGRRAPAPTGPPPPSLSVDDEMQVRRILVPVDFSAASRRALCLAGRLAEAFDARVVVLHVIESTRRAPSAGAAKSAATRLHRFAAKELPGIPLEVLVRPGDPCSNIIGAAVCEHDIDLVVVAPHHSPRLPQSTHGRLAGRIALQAPCPVLIVRGVLPPACRRRRGAAVASRPADGRILVPLDFSFWAQRSLACGVAMARRLRVPLGMLHVAELRARPTEFGIARREQFAADLWTQGTRELESWSRRVPRGVEVRTMIRQGVGWREILAEAGASPTSMIVLGSSGRHSLPDFCRISTEEMVLQFAPCPVLVIPPSGWSRVWACPVPSAAVSRASARVRS